MNDSVTHIILHIFIYKKKFDGKIVGEKWQNVHWWFNGTLISVALKKWDLQMLPISY